MIVMFEKPAIDPSHTCWLFESTCRSDAGLVRLEESGLLADELASTTTVSYHIASRIATVSPER